MTIKLHIDRLILDGLPVTSSQAPLMQAAIEAQLTRLLATNGLGSDLVGGGALATLQADGIQLTNKSNPTLTGQQVANAIYSGIGSKSPGRRARRT